MEDSARFVGQTVGNWRITRLLGEGAFGAVFEADNVSITGRRAAVKILHPHLASSSSIKQRFLNEAIAASRAEHDNIVQIFDGGITPDGICYSVMEMLKGSTLTRIIEQGPMDPVRTIQVGVQVAGALSAAHALHIVHRDLKPDNVFVVDRGGGREVVKVLDFGVAKLRDEDGGALTKTGMMIGTPGYMSPEQWMTLPDIDGRADVYALGVILYECLAGRLPFSGNTPYEWLRAHMEQPAPDLALLVQSPPALAQLVARMLAKKREERPQSMQEVIAALEDARAAQAGSPAPAARPPAPSPPVDTSGAGLLGTLPAAAHPPSRGDSPRRPDPGGPVQPAPAVPAAPVAAAAVPAPVAAAPAVARFQVRPPVAQPGGSSALGVIALVLSCLFFIPFAPFVGLVLGIVGVVKMRAKTLPIIAICIGAVAGPIFQGLIMIGMSAADQASSYEAPSENE